MTDDLSELKRLAEAATPGPWVEEPHGSTVAIYSRQEEWQHGLRLMNLEDGDWNFTNNKAYIAATSPSTILALIARVEKAEEWSVARAMDLAELGAAYGKEKARADAAEARVKVLEEALKPFARECRQRQEVLGAEPDTKHLFAIGNLTVGHLRAARTALGDTND